MSATTIDRLDQVDAGQWNALSTPWQPFTSFEFLAHLESTGCVAADTGWIPRHLVARDAADRLRGAMPLYLKTHSWGEFVFDFAWAQAYARAGLDYYPKLVSMTPFTPVTGRRLLSNGHDPAVDQALVAGLQQAVEDCNASSAHVLYPPVAELDTWAAAGFTIREDCRFMWHNHDYQTFDDFLAALRSAKRKEVRRERRRVAAQGIAVEMRRADSLDERTWQAVYAMLARTFTLRGHTPYVSLRFLREIADALGPSMLVSLASADDSAVGAAVFFRDQRSLYGRYWGSNEDIDCLHFETCYYQGIDYCIRNGLRYFDPGTQGEHKVRRGFAPIRTYSAHLVADPRFAGPIADWVADERNDVAHYIEVASGHLPYR
ncbi:MAG: GNAT family N-acetyltransferase [Gammaproteobacteria bacterium]|nr:GNAT family N-acetyltransferase [Gammaproteobacteria bacterium]